jgi:hypothetical protein
MQQTHAVVEGLHAVVLSLGRHQTRMYEWRQAVVAQHHQGIGLQGVQDETGGSLRPDLQFRPLDE